ncbi:MAG: GNAT family N-acetyltransferase [Gammaproteobacteria bacterium]|nr:GNAT family N-acetyltransferase [Gammaproteobacteria bacterium]
MSDQAIVVELADERDALALSLLTRDEIESGFGWNYRPDRFKALMREKETVVLVARAEPSQTSDVAGFGVMNYGVKDAHLRLLATAPTHRRRGIARRLLAWLEKTARYAGIQSIHLEVRQGNSSALAFYHSLGYLKKKLIADYYRGPNGLSENAWHMVKNLSTTRSLEL